DFLPASLHGNAALFDTTIVEIVEIDHFADFRQAEADILGTQDPREPSPVALRIDPRQPVPCRRDQSFLFVKAQCTGGASEFAREVSDRILFARRCLRALYMRALVGLAADR